MKTVTIDLQVLLIVGTFVMVLLGPILGLI